MWLLWQIACQVALCECGPIPFSLIFLTTNLSHTMAHLPHFFPYKSEIQVTFVSIATLAPSSMLDMGLLYFCVRWVSDRQSETWANKQLLGIFTTTCAPCSHMLQRLWPCMMPWSGSCCTTRPLHPTSLIQIGKTSAFHCDIYWVTCPWCLLTIWFFPCMAGNVESWRILWLMVLIHAFILETILHWLLWSTHGAASVRMVPPKWPFFISIWCMSGCPWQHNNISQQSCWNCMQFDFPEDVGEHRMQSKMGRMRTLGYLSILTPWPLHTSVNPALLIAP